MSIHHHHHHHHHHINHHIIITIIIIIATTCQQPGKPRWICAAKKLRNKKMEKRWADKNLQMEANPFQKCCSSSFFHFS
jgi:hypothetical protein